MSLRNSVSYPGFSNVGETGWMDDGVSPAFEVVPGQLARVGGTIFSAGPQANQAAPGTALVNLWSMPIPPNFLNAIGRSMSVEAVGYWTSDGTSATPTLQLLLGTIPLVSLATSAVVKISLTQSQFVLETLTTTVGAGTSTTSNLESHGWVSYSPTTAKVLQTETDANLVSGNLNPDLTQANTLFITFQASAAHLTNVVLKSVVVSVWD